MPAPRPQRLVRSAGALVWRFMDPARLAAPGEVIDPADIEVLMVHRPRYHDWSWPKGKAEHGEPLVAAAVREVEEETGQVVTLGAPLTTQRYRLGGGQTKEVHYWVGTPVSGGPAAFVRAPVARAPRTEIDRAEWVAPERAAEMLTRRGDRRLLFDLLARAREGRLVTTTLLVLRPGQGLTPRLDEAGDVHAPASPSASSGGSAAPAEASAPSEPRPAPTPAMVASAAARRAAQVEQASAKKTENAPEPVDPPLSRFGVRQAFDLIDLLSSFGVARAFASPAARSRQSLTPWASMGGGSVTLVESLDLAASGPDAQVDAEARLGRVRAFAAERLREHAAPTVLSVTGSVRDAIIEEIRAYASAPVAGAEAPRLTRGQVLVAHVEHGPDGLVVAALETHGVTTKNPAAHTRRGNKRH
ncbi:NUDIX hydrolase [Schaalia odontolytica]|uniref:NUDIX hydrolase n=1 Tax=Schaalia odontolytica TaxID=1660 RepID=UPI00211C3A0F|nr:NUDIX hydrolase [Schaalia odontolytica]UUO94566.1 NUDIX hydrolase [Schaalia odontolytica]